MPLIVILVVQRDSIMGDIVFDRLIRVAMFWDILDILDTMPFVNQKSLTEKHSQFCL